VRATIAYLKMTWTPETRRVLMGEISVEKIVPVGYGTKFHARSTNAYDVARGRLHQLRRKTA